MRRVVNGVTYNTDTATLIASTDYDNSDEAGPRGTLLLYQTRGGAFFLHDHEVLAYRDRLGEWQERERDLIEPMSRERAHEWVLEQNVELHDTNAFGEPPEAAAEQAPEATIYARVPVSLKNRVEAQAKAESLSVNSFVLRCLERCAADRSAAPTVRNALLDTGLAPADTATGRHNSLISGSPGIGAALAALLPSPDAEQPTALALNKLFQR